MAKPKQFQVNDLRGIFNFSKDDAILVCNLDTGYKYLSNIRTLCKEDTKNYYIYSAFLHYYDPPYYYGPYFMIAKDKWKWKK